MPLRKLPKVMWEHSKAGIPDPCIKVRKGSGKVLTKVLFDPSTIIDVELGTLIGGKKVAKKSQVARLKKHKKVKVCLW